MLVMWLLLLLAVVVGVMGVAMVPGREARRPLSLSRRRQVWHSRL